MTSLLSISCADANPESGVALDFNQNTSCVGAFLDLSNVGSFAGGSIKIRAISLTSQILGLV